MSYSLRSQKNRVSSWPGWDRNDPRTNGERWRSAKKLGRKQEGKSPKKFGLAAEEISWKNVPDGLSSGLDSGWTQDGLRLDPGWTQAGLRLESGWTRAGCCTCRWFTMASLQSSEHWPHWLEDERDPPSVGCPGHWRASLALGSAIAGAASSAVELQHSRVGHESRSPVAPDWPIARPRTLDWSIVDGGLRRPAAVEVLVAVSLRSGRRLAADSKMSRK